MAGEPTWPTFPGESGEPEVEPIGGKTIVTELQSGGVYKVGTSTTVRTRYTFRYTGLRSDVAAPAPYAAYSEAGCVRYLLEQLHGGLGAVYVVDPIDGVSRLCQLEADSIPLRKVRGSSWYEAEISFLTV